MENEISTITKSKLESYLKIAGVAQNLTKEETENFLNIAMDFNLNPFKREIYCTSYGQGEYRKTSIIIGYEVYIKRAERTGQLDGWNVTTEGNGDNLSATITIYRKDQKYPFTHTVDYSEYVQTTYDKETKKQRPNQIWATKPKTMLKKVATAQGFRLCFSDELGGMPYESEELPGTHEREIIIESQGKKLDSIPEPNIIEQYFSSLPTDVSFGERVTATIKWIESNEEIQIKEAAYDKLIAIWNVLKQTYDQKGFSDKWLVIAETIPGFKK